MEEGAKNGWDDKGSARLGAERSKRWASRRAGGWADGPAMAALPSHTSFTRMEKALQRSRLPSRCARACLRAAHAPASARRRRPQAIAQRKGTSKKWRQQNQQEVEACYA